jgi:hypothetical protein
MSREILEALQEVIGAGQVGAALRKGQSGSQTPEMGIATTPS